MRLQVIFLLAVFFSWPTMPQSPKSSSAEQCREFVFSARINGGEEYSRQLGARLWLRLLPLGGNWGWIIEVHPEGSKDDYGFPLNPPFHFGNSQYLGTGYGDTVEYQMTYEHRVFFASNEEEYQRAVKVYEDTIDSRDPAGAGKFLSALPSMRSSVLTLKPEKFETSDGGKSVSWMQFSVTVTAPKAFEPAPDIKKKNATCRSGEL